jgi:hypothetical protein
LTWELASSPPIAGWLVSAGNTAVGGFHPGARFWALVLVALLLAAAVYIGACRIWPYGPCLACRAHPRRNPGSTGKRHGRCRVCRGSGERLRVGTRIIRATGYKGGRWPS